MDAPLAIKWLEDLGVMFDKEPDGTMVSIHGGGTARRRMHSARDYSGAGIMRVLRDEVRSYPEDITVLEFAPAIELIMDDKGQVVKRKLAYAGNKFKDEEIEIAPLEEIDKAMKNRYGVGRSNFNVAPEGSVPFTLVFENLPENLSEFTVEAVSSAPGT